jgi:hypothetical protein
MIELTEQQKDKYFHKYRTFNAAVEAAYNDGYEQALKDLEHFEETGVVIL